MPVSGEAEAPPKKSDRTRTSILDAAARLFARRGYTDTNLSEIAAEAGMKAGSLYYHFESKEDLVYEELRYAVAHSFEHTRAEVESRGPRASAADRPRAPIRAPRGPLHSL